MVAAFEKSRFEGPPSSLRDLERVHAPTGGLYASAGDLFRDMLFGRDMLEAAEDLDEWRPDLTREGLLALAAIQGSQCAPDGRAGSEEEPGRRPHQAVNLY